jgi:hypothetical protein
MSCNEVTAQSCESPGNFLAAALSGLALGILC